MNCSFHGKTMGTVRNTVKKEILGEGDKEKTIKQQSKLPFNGLHKSYTNYDSYTFKQNKVVTDNPICLGFAIL